MIETIKEYQEAREAYDAEEFEKAKAISSKALAADPDNLYWKLLLGLCECKTGDAQHGVRLIVDVASLIIESEQWFDHLQHILAVSPKTSLIIACCREVIESDQVCTDAYDALGLVLYLKYRMPEAIEVFGQAIDFDPQNPEPYLYRGSAFKVQEDYADAINDFRTAIKLDPNCIRAHIQLGRVRLNQDRDNDALSCFQDALSIDPNSWSAYVEMGRTYSHLLDHEKAKEYLEKAASHAAHCDIPLVLLGQKHQEDGNFEDALKFFERAYALNPTRPDTLYGLVKTKKIQQADIEFVRTIKEVLESSRKAPEKQALLHHALGKAYDDLGEYGPAMEHFDQAFKLSSQSERTNKKPFNSARQAALLNARMQIFSKEFFNKVRSKGSPSELPILIIGMPRSGTTLVEQILSSHPEVAAAGELTFWSDNAPKFIDPKPPSGIHPQILAPIQDAYIKLLRTYGPTEARVTDKMPLNYFYVGNIHAAFPNARFIHCRRHPVDTCISIMSIPSGMPGTLGESKENLVFLYKEYLRHMEHWRTIVPNDRLLEVDYSELILNHEAMTRKMIAFLGLEWDDACLQHEKNERTVQTPSLWQARQPIYKTSLERWRRYAPWLGPLRELLTEEELQSIA